MKVNIGGIMSFISTFLSSYSSTYNILIEPVVLMLIRPSAYEFKILMCDKCGENPSSSKAFQTAIGGFVCQLLTAENKLTYLQK